MTHMQFQLKQMTVAHKMGRRWTILELDERGHTHTIQRLKKVIDGEGKGRSGLRYHKRAPSPKMVLARCEWGHDDHSLNVANLPMAAPENAPENAVEKQVAQPAQRTAGSFGDSTRDSER
jgi:hypothetical protein